MNTTQLTAPRRAIYGTWYNDGAYQSIYGQGCIYYRDSERDNSRNICCCGVMTRAEVIAYAGNRPVFDISNAPLSIIGNHRLSRAEMIAAYRAASVPELGKAHIGEQNHAAKNISRTT